MAMWAADMRSSEQPLPPATAWQVMERILARPKEPGQLLALARFVPGALGSGMMSIRRGALENAFVSGKLVLLPRQTSAPSVKPDTSESTVEQIRAAQVVKTWVEMEVVDDLGHSMAGERYVCMLPDGRLEEGHLDARGRVRFDGIDPGSCVFSLTDLHADDWRAG
jgi:hypothetical protein